MKILIADDEYYTVQLVNSQLDWKLLGIENVLMAYNGADAVDIFDAEKPEIVLCDIDMPGLDGMAVLCHVLETAPDTKFIFLTCFERFDYVQKAIHLGAFDYLTKPFSEPDVYAAIMKASAAIQDREEMQGTRSQNNSRLVRELLTQAVSPDRQAVEFALRRKNTSYNINEQYRMVLSCMAEKSGSGAKETGIYHFVFRNILAELFTGNAESMDAVEISFEGIYGLVCVLSRDMDMPDLLSRAEQLSSSVEEHLHTAFTCVIGTPKYLWNFAEAAEQLKTAAVRQFLNSVRVGMHRLERDGNSGEFVSVDEKLIHSALEEQDVSGIIDYLRMRLDDMQQKVQLSPFMIHQLNADVMQIIFSFCSEKEIAAHDLYQDSEVMELQKRAEQMPFYLIRCTELVCTKVCELLREQGDEDVIVRRIEDFVRAHYSEPIGRDDIAAELHYSKNYLSRLFKKQLGLSVRDYINGFRIEAAKKMLRETGRSVGDIALEVGFDSMTYFSTVFKKNTELTPAQYRSMG